MSAANTASRIVGLLLGLAIVAAAIAWALLLRGRTIEKDDAPMVRPLLVFTVGETPPEVRRFPARVRATSEANLAFEVAGVVRELPVVRGRRVKQGDLLAQLDLRDFTSRLASAEANLERQREELGRRQRAFEQGAATEMEIIRARAAFDTAQADRDIAKKSLEDATLVAPFDGLIADVFVDQFQKVSPGTRVARIQGGEGIRVEVNVEAGRVALARQINAQTTYAVRFDFLPEREYPAELVEYTTEADRATQTFRAFLQFAPPTDVAILPGMTATVIEHVPLGANPAETPLTAPLSAVVFDADQRASVWVVEDSGGGAAVVRRTPVTLGEVIDERVRIASGVARGARVAAAGVHQLGDGQRVRPVDAASAASLR